MNPLSSEFLLFLFLRHNFPPSVVLTTSFAPATLCNAHLVLAVPKSFKSMRGEVASRRAAVWKQLQLGRHCGQEALESRVTEISFELRNLR